MKHENVDDLITEALSKEEAEFYHQLDEQTLWQSMWGLFQGKNKWINIIALLIQFALIFTAIYCLLHFLDASETNDLIKWGAGMFACMLTSSMVKLQQWLQMETNKVMREVKRLEFQVSLISEKQKR